MMIKEINDRRSKIYWVPHYQNKTVRRKQRKKRRVKSSTEENL